MMRMDASSMSWLRFAGASESPDGRGVFSDQWKQMKHQPAQSPSIVQHFNMLVLDGHCPAVWLENILASMQINDHPGCQGKSLAETSRNASPFLSESGPKDADSIKARLVLEAVPQSFSDASPAWASFAFVHVDPGCVVPDVIIHKWLQSHHLLYQRQVAKQLGIFFPRFVDHLFAVCVACALSLLSLACFTPT
jgi:hypothetical protein